MGPGRFARPYATLLAAALVTGCSDCVTLPGPAPLSVVGGPAGAAPAAIASPQVRREVRVIDGVARYFGVPLADAAITVHALGTRNVLATTTAGPEGQFTVVLDLGVAPGTILEFVAEAADGRRVASAGTVPEARELLQRTGRTRVLLDEAQTTALMVLGPRIVAAIQLGTPDAMREAMQSFVAAAEALGSENAAAILAPASFDVAVAKVLDTIGEIIQTPEAREAVAAAIPADVVPLLVAEADSLAATIRSEVGKGQPRPDEVLLVALPIGPQVVPPVFTDGTSRSADPTGEPPAGPAAPPAGGGTGGGGTPPGSDDNYPPVSPVVELTPPEEGRYGKPGKPIAGGAQ